jgi:hypothetical protein
MNWEVKYNKEGDTRIVSGFAWLPIETSSFSTCANPKQVVWLQFYKLKQRFTSNYGWLNVRFLDKNSEEV